MLLEGGWPGDIASVAYSDMDTTPKLLRPSEAAKILCVDKRTLARWADAGKLSVVMVGATGKHRRYYADEIEGLMRRDTGPGVARSPDLPEESTGPRAT